MKASIKSTLYRVLVVLDGSGNVSCAACTCPAGAGISGLGNCNHVGGVLFALEDFKRKDYNNCPEPVSSILDIEKETCGQSSNSSWNQHRLYRITASHFYSAAVTTVEPSSKLNSMFYSSFSSVSTRHGKAYESHVRSLYLETLLRNGFNRVFVDEPSLVVSSPHSFLGASLNGIVKHGQDSWGLEIKCPYSKFSLSLHDAVADKKFF
eukprot:gene5723-10976_t